MFLPIGDSPNPHQTAWITRTLIALNVAVYLFVTLPLNRGLTKDEVSEPGISDTIKQMWKLEEEGRGQRLRPAERQEFLVNVSRYDLFVFEHGYKPAAPSLFDLLLCMFLHANLMHMVGNMLFLWIFGDNVEARLGRLGYVLGYLATGIVATLAFALTQRNSMIPLVGASGAISGVLGFYFLWFPRNIVKVFIWLGFWFMDVVPISARIVLLIFVVIDNLLPLLLSSGSSVAYGAHLGGFVAGVALAFLLRNVARERPLYDEYQRPLWARRPSGPRGRRFHETPEIVVDESHAPGHAAPRSGLHLPEHGFAEALQRGNMRHAVDLFRRRVVPGYEPATSAQLFALGDWLMQYGASTDAHAVLAHYLRRFPDGPELAAVHLRLGVLLADHFGRKLAAREHFLTTIDLSPPGSAMLDEARQRLARI